MREHKEKVLAYHRRGFYFEIKKDTIYNYILLGLAGAIGY